MTVAVGFFDGVHLGHRAILDGADEALTFMNHPLSVLAPAKSPCLIMSLEERLRTIALPTMVLEFTTDLASMSAADFAARFLKGRRIRCGGNWNFGCNGEGNPEWLKANGYDVEVIPFEEYRGEPISSTRIRMAIKAGRIDEVEAMTGRRFSVRGSVVPGKGEGCKLGYPTVNLRLGVYAAEVDGEKAIVNYGHAPTFGERAWPEPTMEVHLLRYLREERKFDSVDALKAQISDDIRRVL